MPGADILTSGGCILGGEGALGGINAADAQMGTQRGSPARRAVTRLN